MKENNMYNKKDINEYISKILFNEEDIDFFTWNGFGLLWNKSKADKPFHNISLCDIIIRDSCISTNPNHINLTLIDPEIFAIRVYQFFKATNREI